MGDIRATAAQLAVLVLMLVAVASASCSLTKGQITEVKLTWAGNSRSALVYVPISAGDNPPLVLFYHGSGGSAQGSADGTKWKQTADSAGFVVAFMQGLNAMWMLGGDDLGMTRQYITLLNSMGCADKQRVYASGWSMGAWATNALGCQCSDVIAAVSPCSWIYQSGSCSGRAAPILGWHGTWDTFTGGSDPHQSLLNSLSFWASRGKCSVTGAIAYKQDSGGDYTPLTCRMATCPDSSVYNVTMCEFWGSHQYVTGKEAEIWKFFKRFTLSGASSDTKACTLSGTPTNGGWGTCSTSVTSGSSCSFTCPTGSTAVTGFCSNGNWQTTPSCSVCTPTSTCTSKSQTCGTLWNGCATVSCGSCSDGQSCDGSSCVTGTAGTLDDWEQVYPDSDTTGNWKMDSGAIELTNFDNSATPRCLAYKGAQDDWFDASTVTVSVYVKATEGQVQAGLRMGQTTGIWDRLGWALLIENNGAQARAAYCRFLNGPPDDCTDWSNPIAADSNGGFTLKMQFEFGSDNIAVYSWINDQGTWWWSRTEPASNFPAKGRLFLWVKDTINVKSFSKLTVTTGTTVHTVLGSSKRGANYATGLSTTAWTAFVSSVLNISTDSIVTRAVKLVASASTKRDGTGGDLASEFYTTLTDNSGELASTSSLKMAQMLQSAVSDGAASLAGISVASVSVVTPAIAAGTVALPAAAAAATTVSAAVAGGIAAGAAIAGMIVAGGVAAVAVAKVRRDASSRQSDASVHSGLEMQVEQKKARGGIDIMNNPEQADRTSITARAPPMAL